MGSTPNNVEFYDGIVKAGPMAAHGANGQPISSTNPQPFQLRDASGNVFGSQANPMATNQVVGTPLTNSNTGAAGAQVLATLTGTATTKVYINGFIVTTHAPAANQTGQVTVTGVIGGTMNFTLCESATIGGEMIIFFPDPIPATAINTPIVV